MNDMFAQITGEARMRLGRLAGFDAGGAPLVSVSGLPPAPSDSLVALTEADRDCDLVVSPHSVHEGRPLVLGRLASREVRAGAGTIASITETGDKVTIRCGAARITLHADGRITLRGREILSRASGANRVQGGSVDLN